MSGKWQHFKQTFIIMLSFIERHGFVLGVKVGVLRW